MSVLIKSVTISPNNLTVGQSFTVQVHAEEVTWNTLKNDLQSWGEVRRSFANWNKVKDFIYSVSSPVPDANVVYTADDYALFDVDGNQVSISGGATLQHTSSDIDDFLRKVLDE